MTPGHGVAILGTGSYLPERVVPNAEMVKLVGVTEEWIERKTQIRARRYAAPHEATSDLAVQASVRALAQANVHPGRLDYLIMSTSTGDHPQPPTAYLVQAALGAWSAACFDVNVVCSGFVYALALAHCLITARPGSTALVIGADVYSRCLDYSDRRTSVLLGDGAGAVVVGTADAPGLVGFELVSRGDAHGLIGVAAGGSRNPASHATVTAGDHYFMMDGRSVREFALIQVPPVIEAFLRKSGVEPDEVRHVVPHQPNGVLLTELSGRLALSAARTHRTVERYGNVGSACVPVTLDDAHRAGRLAEGDLVLLVAFGGGMSIGAGLMYWRNFHVGHPHDGRGIMA